MAKGDILRCFAAWRGWRKPNHEQALRGAKELLSKGFLFRAAHGGGAVPSVYGLLGFRDKTRAYLFHPVSLLSRRGINDAIGRGRSFVTRSVALQQIWLPDELADPVL